MGRRSRELRERRRERELTALRSLRLVETAPERGCLFCRKGDGGFKSVEHVFSESLGNKEIILPRGVVCDRCNHGPLSQLDDALLAFPPVALQRTFRGVPNKKGQIRPLSLTGETIDYRPGVGGANPTIVVTSKTPGKSAVRNITRLPGGGGTGRLQGSGGRRVTPRYASQISRALLKSALESAWLGHGETTLEPRYDHVRAAVLGEPRDGYFIVATQSDNPNSRSVSLTQHLVQEKDEWRMAVRANIFGVPMWTDSRLARPLSEPPQGRAQVFTFTGSGR